MFNKNPNKVCVRVLCHEDLTKMNAKKKFSRVMLHIHGGGYMLINLDLLDFLQEVINVIQENGLKKRKFLSFQWTIERHLRLLIQVHLTTVGKFTIGF